MDDPARLQEAMAELRTADRLTGPSDETCAAVMAAWAAKHEASVFVPMPRPDATVVRPAAWPRVLIASGVAACLVAAVGAGWWVSRLPTTTGEVANELVANESIAHASPAPTPARTPTPASAQLRPTSTSASPAWPMGGEPSLAAVDTPRATAAMPVESASEPPAPSAGGHGFLAARRRAAAGTMRAGEGPVTGVSAEGTQDGAEAAFVELAPTTAEDWAAARVLRVRVPEHAIRRLLLEPPGFTSGGMVQADLVLGEDGFARAIRLVHEPAR